MRKCIRLFFVQKFHVVDTVGGGGKIRVYVFDLFLYPLHERKTERIEKRKSANPQQFCLDHHSDNSINMNK